MKNHGTRIDPVKRAQYIIRVHDLPEVSQKQKRDKLICKLFFEHNLSASAISRMNDPNIIGLGNRSKGKPLSTTSILRRVYCTFPEFERTQTDNRESTKKRIELRRKRKTNVSRHIHQCAFCGSTDNLEEHHMIPLSMGGTNDENNLVFLCYDCHKQVSGYQARLRECRV